MPQKPPGKWIFGRKKEKKKERGSIKIYPGDISDNMNLTDLARIVYKDELWYKQW